MALNKVPVDSSKFSFCKLVGVVPKERDGEQATNSDGVLLFTVSVLVEAMNAAGSPVQELIKVTVPGDGRKAPGDGIPAFSDVRFDSLMVGSYVGRGDNSAFFFSADAVHVAKGGSPAQAQS